ncbi:hypothetical protein QBC32DRAFT_225578, partial [Pseudoneurospora amorphoporcata]
WGSNYEKLVGVKREWDPSGVFWAPVTVGSEGWVEESEWEALSGRPVREGEG